MENSNIDSNHDLSIYEILGISSESSSYSNVSSNDADETDSHSNSSVVPVDFSLSDKLYRLCMPLGIFAAAIPLLIWLFSSIWTSAVSSTQDISQGGTTQLEKEVASGEAIASSGVYVSDIFSSPMYFEGTINNEYRIHLYIDPSDYQGKYYYQKYGAGNCMILKIINMTPNADNSIDIVMEESTVNGVTCGRWEGSLNSEGLFEGSGEFLGTTMPFNLKSCPQSNTEF